MRGFLLLLGLWPNFAAADCLVLLHGLGRSDASLLVIEQMALRRGYEVVNAGYPSTEGSVDALAGSVVGPAIASCKSAPVHVVTHSMGGILLRQYVASAVPDELGHVVMLGPPNQGSELVDHLGSAEVFGTFVGEAGLALGTGLEDVPRSLPEVNFSLGVIAGNESLNPASSAMIPGPDDGKVSVVSTKVAGMADHITLPVTHTFMMNDPSVMAQTFVFLETGRFDPSRGWLEVLGQRPEN